MRRGADAELQRERDEGSLVIPQQSALRASLATALSDVGAGFATSYFLINIKRYKKKATTLPWLSALINCAVQQRTRQEPNQGKQSSLTASAALSPLPSKQPPSRLGSVLPFCRQNNTPHTRGGVQYDWLSTSGSQQQRVSTSDCCSS